MSSDRRKPYPFDEFEPRWQALWDAETTFRTPGPGDPDFDPSKPKFYVLDMFPYPSGSGLHVGHPEGYTATDILGRTKRMQGFNVLHPMGWDAFGLPAEQYAIKTGQHPRITTAANVETFRRQLKALGFGYDWDREVNTTDPNYLKWTQWIFLQLYHSYFCEETRKARPVSELEARGWAREEIDAVRLAFVADTPVWWSPDLGTVLANEEVEEWKSKGHTVERRPLRQWMLRITKYAQRLIDELDDLDWPEGIKLLQKNWIGRSEGAEVEFTVAGTSSPPAPTNEASSLQTVSSIRVFTTRPDTLFGATYMVLAPEHPLVPGITTAAQRSVVETYQKMCAAKSDMERGDLNKDKTGVFTGAYAINPVNNEKIPVWIADYVMMGYGTGAIMAVPAHDERDFEFAKKFQLSVRQVVAPVAGTSSPSVLNKKTGEPKFRPAAPFIWRFGKHLPHLTREGSIYSVTFRLGDSLPAPVFNAFRAERDGLLKKTKAEGTLSPDEEKRLDRLLSDKIQAYLDAGHGVCHLRDPRIAQLVRDALHHFDGERYELIAWCIMPNHVHLIVKPLTHELPAILQSWKTFTAREANKLLGSAGTFWQEEYYDHLIRDDDDFAAQVSYLMNNPAAAGLADWQWTGYTGRWIDQPVAGTSSPPQSAAETSSPPDEHGAAGGPEVHATVEDGIAINSAFLNGLPTAEAKQKIIIWLEEKGLGKRRVQYKLRDWLFSRQRYWGEPFPIVWENGQHRAIPESELPLLQPDLDDFKPTGDPRGPLIKATDWIRYTETAQRETNTMPQWAGSCWYYIRYCDPANNERFISKEAERYWLGGNGRTGAVDLYVGGTEHAVLHLLYARFWHKVLCDLGHLSTSEPFQRLVNQGLILGEDGQKMSKSVGNVINPDHVIELYGADSLRLYEMFMGPLEQVKPWSMKGVEGVSRFLARVWRLAFHETGNGWLLNPKLTAAASTDKALRRVVHETIRKVTEDVEKLSFNTAISQMMICTNAFTTAAAVTLTEFVDLLLCLNPFAPHVSEEIYAQLRTSFPELDPRQLCQQSWPKWDPAALVVDEIEIVVQVNGRLRDKVTVPSEAGNAMVEAAALAAPKIIESIGAGTVVKVIVVPKKLVNVVVK